MQQRQTTRENRKVMQNQKNGNKNDKAFLMFIIRGKLLIYRQWKSNIILKNAILKKVIIERWPGFFKIYSFNSYWWHQLLCYKKKNILELIYGYVLKRKKSNNCLKNKCLARDADTLFVLCETKCKHLNVLCWGRVNNKKHLHIQP